MQLQNKCSPTAIGSTLPTIMGPLGIQPDSSLQAVLSSLHGIRGPDKHGWYTAFCPFHDDRHHPNLRLRETGFRCMACGENGGLKKIAIKLSIPLMEKKQMSKVIAATYDYKDEKGVLLFQVVRYQPKAFRQRRPIGKNRWAWDLDGVPRALYLLPELIASPKDVPVYVPEGEKDVEALHSLGLVATCNSGGAGKFTDEIKQPLTNKFISN